MGEVTEGVHGVGGLDGVVSGHTELDGVGRVPHHPVVGHAEKSVDGVNETSSAGVRVESGGSLNESVKDHLEVAGAGVLFFLDSDLLSGFKVYVVLLKLLLSKGVALDLGSVRGVLVSLAGESGNIDSNLFKNNTNKLVCDRVHMKRKRLSDVLSYC